MRHRAVVLLCLLAPGLANAALIGRAPLTPGGADYQAYYDNLLDITWVADANLAATQGFGVPGIAADGSMTWATAADWIAGMNAAAYLGQSDWRLPDVKPVNGVAFDYTRTYFGGTDLGYSISAPFSAYPGSTASELAHLYYNTLGNLAFCGPFSSGDTCVPQAGGGLNNTGPFANLLAATYWTGVELTPGSDFAFAFRFGFQSGFFPGNQGGTIKAGARHAWAVRDGDLTVVPLPGAAGLFAGALLLLRRRRP